MPKSVFVKAPEMNKRNKTVQMCPEVSQLSIMLWLDRELLNVKS